MSYKNVESLIYKRLEYAVGAIVKFKDTQGITQPKGTLTIRTLFPPDMVMVVEEGTSWTSVCSLDAIQVLGKPATDEFSKMFEKTKDKEFLEETIDELSDLYDGDTDNQEPEVVIIVGGRGEGMTDMAATTPTAQTSCINCGRTLTAPRSVACGYGPKCYRDLFGKPQPRLKGERRRTPRGVSKKVSEIDYSLMNDARTFFAPETR